ATGSMSLQGKADHAASLAAGLALAGLAARDQVRLGCYGGGDITTVTGEDPRALPKMIHALEGLTPGGDATGRDAVLAWTKGKRFDRAVLISDMLIPPDDAERLLSSLAVSATQRTLLHVLSEADRTPELTGTLELEDVESGETLVLESGAGITTAYQEAFVRWHRGLTRLCKRLRIQLIDAPVTIAPGALLVGPLRHAGLLISNRGGSA
ncbi:MAG: hypothetical protein AAFV53_16050, partial [Myxococcota bacterium]